MILALQVIYVKNKLSKINLIKLLTNKIIYVNIRLYKTNGDLIC